MNGAVRWLMTSPGAPLVSAAFTPSPGPGEVVVEIAGCGVCHTDLGYYYNGVRTKHDLPLTLGHEISGHVVDTGSDAGWWKNRAVIVAAVIPCGTCDACRRGKSTICPNQKMPGNDIHGGFATHIVVPARGLCAVDEALLKTVGIELADVSVIADAVTTPYQAVVQGGVGEGDLVVVNGVGGVGGYAVQIANAFGGKVVAIDVNPDRLAAIGQQGAALTLDARKAQGPRSQVGDPGVRQAERAAPGRMDHLRVLGHARRPGNRVRPDQPRRDTLCGRFHHGQGGNPALQPHGLPRARSRQLGMPAGALPGGIGHGF